MRHFLADPSKSDKMPMGVMSSHTIQPLAENFSCPKQLWEDSFVEILSRQVIIPWQRDTI